jgi:hypothetical protein
MTPEHLRNKIYQWFYRRYFDDVDFPFEEELLQEVISDPSKYIAYCYWEHGHTVTVEDEQGIVDICNDIFGRSEEELYQVIVFDSNGTARRPWIDSIKLPQIPEDE